MGSDWKETTLGEVVNFRRGHDLPRSKMVEGDVPVIGSNGIIGSHNESTSPTPCITIGRSGNVGKPYLSKVDSWAHNTTLYIDDYKGNDLFFVYHFLKTLELENFSGGSAVPTLNRNHIHPIEVTVPPLPEQKAIAHILGTLDDKIELNRRMNATLEGMAQALFKSWFVNFDPVIDNALAAGNPIPDELAPRAEVRKNVLGERSSSCVSSPKDGAAAPSFPEFPAAFQFTEQLVWIPEGWEALKWGSIAELNYGKSIKGYRDANGAIPVFGTNGPIGFADDAMYEGEGVIIGRKGAYRGVHYSPSDFSVIDTAFYLVPQIQFSMKWAYYELLRFDINGMDSGSAIPSTSREDFYSLESVIPSSELQKRFDRIVDSLYSKKDWAIQQCDQLTKLRDTLLPKLISGELRIPETEQLTEEALA